MKPLDLHSRSVYEKNSVLALRTRVSWIPPSYRFGLALFLGLSCSALLLMMLLRSPAEILEFPEARLFEESAEQWFQEALRVWDTDLALRAKLSSVERSLHKASTLWEKMPSLSGPLEEKEGFAEHVLQHGPLIRDLLGLNGPRRVVILIEEKETVGAFDILMHEGSLVHGEFFDRHELPMKKIQSDPEYVFKMNGDAFQGIFFPESEDYAKNLQLSSEAKQMILNAKSFLETENIAQYAFDYFSTLKELFDSGDLELL